MPTIPAQPEIERWTSWLDPGETADFVSIAYDSVLSLQDGLPEEIYLASDELEVVIAPAFIAITGLATVEVHADRVLYELPLDPISGSSMMLSSPTLTRINSADATWGLPSGVITTDNDLRHREDHLASLMVVDLMGIALPSYFD